ncbi:MAG: hypothetical protein QOI22_1335 [Verrucomicrobiota bacterium]|jgi:hypothetical protein
MKNLLVLTLCLALTGLVRAEQDNSNNKGKGKKQTTQAVTAKSQVPQVPKHNVSTPNNLRVRSNTPLQSSGDVNGGKYKKLKGSQNAGATVQSKAQLQSNAKLNASTKPWKVQKLAIQKNTNISPVHFNGGAHIAGSQNWQGSNYNAFRLYTSQSHNQIWWRSHYPRIILVGGGYYYWDNGWWYPAWGYDPSYQFYAYDGPIYGYNSLPPDQVIANVQAALQRDGYYHGGVDGMLGPLTRDALARYQADHGLYVTQAIDRPTLSSLGMS